MKQTGREKVGSREMTSKEHDAFTEVKELMDLVNTGDYSKEAQDEFVQAVVGCGAASAMQNRYILTQEESDVLIAALRKITGKALS